MADGTLVFSAGHRLRLPDGEDDGIYAGWRWTGADLLIEHDRYGLYPLFVWKSGDTSVLSNELLTLIELGAPTTLDLDALSVFLRVGFFIGDDTPFQEIRAVSSPRMIPKCLDISRDAAIDGFIELARAAISRRLPSGPYVMPLSGGRDSRHILFALCDAGCPPAGCATVHHFPPRGNDDALVARQLCMRLGIKHTVLAQPTDRVAAERQKNRRTHLCTDEHAQFLILAEHLVEHTRETYDGIAGDVLSQSSYLRPEMHGCFERGDARAAAAFVLDGYGFMVQDEALEQVLAPDLYRDVPRERALARLTTEIAGHANTPNPTGSFFFYNRTRREIALAPYGLMRNVLVYAPYLDRDLFDFLSGLPARLLMHRQMHTDAIARAWPQHAGIPYEPKTLNVDNRTAQRSLARALIRVASRPSSRRFIQRPKLLARLFATALDGAAHRLWYASLLLYLDQLAAVVAGSLKR